MRSALLLLALLAAPGLAHAGVDFKCESVKSGDQLSGWLRFGFSGGDGQVQLDYWAGYPPIAIVDADLDNGRAVTASEILYNSAADRQEGTVALVVLPTGFISTDKFLAKVTLQYKATDNRAAKNEKHDLNCVRH